MWVYLNDRFVPQEEAVVSVFDHGFLYGDGVFETLRAYRGRVFQLSEHLNRLERSAARIQLALPAGRDQMAGLVREFLQRNHLQEASLRITVSRGAGEIGLDPTLCKAPTLVIIARPFQPYPESLYTEGVLVIVARTRRNLPEALPPQVKSLNFLNNILAKMEAKAAGAHEALMLNHRDELTEGTTSNVFVVQQGRVRTPAVEYGILEGITRGWVLQLAAELGIPSEETRLTVEDLLRAEECFLTNTTQEVLPVTRVDGQLIGNGRPGGITRRLHASFRAGLDRFLDRE
ncbi:MAG: branched-chain-amino-acid transaminase [Nitrospirae bacterium]|nr:MAG: branched-chain-amino-acid transaminase [Nitrospirota bacterium]